MRAVAYIRVSSEEQVEGWSLEAQEEKCKQLAEARGYHMTKMYVEPGRSAKTDLRPAFQRMMSDAEAKRFDVIIVHKLDRFSRSLLDVVKNVGRLKKAKVHLVSVSENWIDTTNTMGEMMLYLFAFLAQWDNENRARETAKGKEARAKAGYWNGTLSFGYVTPRKLKAQLLTLGRKFEKGQIDEATYSEQSAEIENILEHAQWAEEGDAIIHPGNSTGVMLAFSTYIAGGKSDTDIATLLNENGYRTTGSHGENLFEGDTVQDMLQNRFYLGQAQYKGQWYPGRHQAIIPKAMFDKALEMRAFRGSRAPRQQSAKRVYPLTRLAVCARCGQPMRGQFGKLYRYYRDPKRTIKVCTQHQIRADQTEQVLIDFLSRIRLPQDWRQRVLEMSMGNAEQVKTIANQRATLEKQLARLRDLYQMGDIEVDVYTKRRNELRDKLTALEPVQEPDVEWAAELLSNMPQLLKAATLEELKQIFAALLKTVYLDSGPRGPIVAIEPRPFVKQLLDVSVLAKSCRNIELRWEESERSDDDDDPDPDGNNGGTSVVPAENGDKMGRDAGEKSVADDGQQPVGSVAGARPEIPQHAAEFCFLNPGSLVRVRPRVGSASTKGNCHSPDLKSIYFTVLLNAPE
jgi:site-specific DNA recombinase